MNWFRSLLAAASLATVAVAGAGSPASAAELSASQRQDYRAVFDAIGRGEWAAATARLDGMAEGPLHAAARAELYVAKGSPTVSLAQIQWLLQKAPEMPQAAQLSRLALRRGATEAPFHVPAQDLRWAGSQPRRSRARSVRGDPVADTLEPQIQEHIVANQPALAEALLNAQLAMLTPAARTEFQQRIGWSYYIVRDDRSAHRLAEWARQGTGEWAVHATWLSGLASWRMRNCRGASDAFASVASRSSDAELQAAGHYWAARSDMMCRQPSRVEGHLRQAARHRETFYGLIAASALGIRDRNYSGLHDFRDAEWRPIAGKPNVRAAIALTEIGYTTLAEEYLKHQARIDPRDHAALLHLAADLDLASAQHWLAHNAPSGASVNLAARYPAPDWQPRGGWRVDRSLVYAHALQESMFRTQVVSPAGAVGLMQVRPGTASDIARSREERFDPSELRMPSANLEYGQSYLEYLRSHRATDGMLPKVIAAYNAGPLPISEWNARQIDGGDPLLYIESIPYWETRGYVPIVLRNYWIYEQQEGKESDSRKALAQGMWPRFPGLPGPGSVRVDPLASTTARQ